MVYDNRCVRWTIDNMFANALANDDNGGAYCSDY